MNKKFYIIGLVVIAAILAVAAWVSEDGKKQATPVIGNTFSNPYGNMKLP